MLKNTMQEKPKTPLERFNEFFTTPRLIMIIGLLLGFLLSMVARHILDMQ